MVSMNDNDNTSDPPSHKDLTFKDIAFKKSEDGELTVNIVDVDQLEEAFNNGSTVYPIDGTNITDKNKEDKKRK